MAKFQSPFEWGFCICNFGPTNQKSFLQFPLAHFCYFTNFQYIFFFKQQNNSWYLNISQHVKHTTGIRISAWDLWNNHSDTTWVKKMGFNSSEGFQRKPVFPAGRWTICSTIGMGASFCSLTFTREIRVTKKMPILEGRSPFSTKNHSSAIKCSWGKGPKGGFLVLSFHRWLQFLWHHFLLSQSPSCSRGLFYLA